MSQRHILLIDDEADICEVASISLETVGGWRVSRAASGVEGIEKAVAVRPDVIMLDVMMPGLDGPATLGRLQAEPATCEIPVIMLTAKTQGADIQHFHELGVAGVLTKPFDPMTLSEQVDDVLAGRSEASARSQAGEQSMDDQMSATVEAVWLESRDEFTGQAETLEAATRALFDERLDEDLRAQAERDAHSLGGALGMFGLHRGSELACELEEALAAPGKADSSHLAELAQALGEEIESRSTA